MTSFAEYLRGYVTEVPTLIILDEPHHLSNENDSGWSDGAAYAFEFARYRLLLTGTPWRTDRTPIPFVTYDANEIVKSDFVYSYKDALTDVPCCVRRVNFPLVDSAVSFRRTGRDKEIRSFDMLEQVPKSQEGDAVRTALDNKVSEWLPTAIRNAHEELMQMRETVPRAGGLLVVSDAEEIRMQSIVSMFRKETGCDPLVITSKVDDPQVRIDKFRDSDAPWAIAVQMISEGVDIPRLRVGVYGTNVRTRLAFRQFVGRFLRVVGDRDYDYASVYVIRTGDMIAYVTEFEDEVYEVLKEQVDECVCSCGCHNTPSCPCGCDVEGCRCKGGGGGETSELLSISGTGEMRETVQSGTAFTVAEMDDARQLKATNIQVSGLVIN